MPNNPQAIPISGSAGFLGSYLVLRLLDSDDPLSIVGLDNLHYYYHPSLKENRLSVIHKIVAAAPQHTYMFIKGELAY